MRFFNRAQITTFMGPTWGPPGSCRPQMGPMLTPWTLLSGGLTTPAYCKYICCNRRVPSQYQPGAVFIGSIPACIWLIASCVYREWLIRVVCVCHAVPRSVSETGHETSIAKGRDGTGISRGPFDLISSEMEEKVYFLTSEDGNGKYLTVDSIWMYTRHLVHTCIQTTHLLYI